MFFAMISSREWMDVLIGGVVEVDLLVHLAATAVAPATIVNVILLRFNADINRGATIVNVIFLRFKGEFDTRVVEVIVLIQHHCHGGISIKFLFR
jgi:hypothetical protein